MEHNNHYKRLFYNYFLNYFVALLRRKQIDLKKYIYIIFNRGFCNNKLKTRQLMLKYIK
jgi:hypothetical protein